MSPSSSLRDFENHYAELHGGRWPALRDALIAAAAREGFSRPNRFFCPDSLLRTHYVMDPASILAAQALDVQHGHSVLDACAAPGGKSLILAEALFLNSDSEISPSSILDLNEPSRARKHRLETVLKEYVPNEIRARIRIHSQPAEQLFRVCAGKFDRILVDAPCSSEAHVLADPAAVAEWTPARPRGLAQRQYAILCSLLECLAPGGRLVYSTCSVHPAENDGVIARVLERAEKKRLPTRRESIAPLPIGEATSHGWAIFPDRAQAGPIFFSILTRG